MKVSTQIKENKIAAIISAIWKLHFIRGVSAGWAIVFFLAKLLDVSELQILRVLKAIVLYWDNIASKLGELIGIIPLIPEVSSVFINSILLTLSIAVPGLWAISKARYQLYQNRLLAECKKRKMKFNFSTSQKFASNTVFIFLWLGLLSCTFMTCLFIGYLLENKVDYNIFLGMLVSGLTYVFIAIPLFRTMREYPPFKKGMLFIFGFLTLIQLLYYLRLPIVSEILTEFSNRVLVAN